MTKVLAIANQKGGVGKTTTAVNLSASLGSMGKRVLLIDLDPQGNATMGCGENKYDLKYSICELLLGECHLSDAIISPKAVLIELIGSNTNLVAAEVALLNGHDNESQLKLLLKPVLNNYDFIIIDCPPSLNMLTINAFTASDGVLIPMQCEYYALEGLSSLLETINKIKTTTNPDFEIFGILRTLYDSRNNLSNDVSAQLSQHFSDKLLKTIIPRNVKLAEAPGFGQSIIDYEPNSKGAIAHLELADEIIQRIQ
jgi:chromosome partitioning protein